MSKLQNILELLQSGIKPTITWTFFDFEKFDESESLLISALNVFYVVDFSTDVWIDIKVGDLEVSASKLFHCSLYTINTEVNIISFQPKTYNRWSQLTDANEQEIVDQVPNSAYVFPQIMNFIEQNYPDLILPTSANLNHEDKTYIQEVVDRLLVAC